MRNDFGVSVVIEYDDLTNDASNVLILNASDFELFLQLDAGATQIRVTVPNGTIRRGSLATINRKVRTVDAEIKSIDTPIQTRWPA